MALDPLSISGSVGSVSFPLPQLDAPDDRRKIDAGAAGVVLPSNGWLGKPVGALTQSDPLQAKVGGVAGRTGAAPASETNGVGSADPAKSKLTSYVGGIDRRQFLNEIQNNPALISKMAWMVRGEVGNSAPLSTKISMLETAFNRAQSRGHSLGQALLSVGESSRGYYATQTYSGQPPSAAEIADFKKNVLAPVLAGSDLTSSAGLGPMTGNASGGVAAHQLGRGTPGYGVRAAGGQTEYLFNEEHRNLNEGKRALARLDEAGAADAAQKAMTAIPNGSFPANPMPALTGGVKPQDAVRMYGTNHFGGRGAGAGRGKRIFRPIPLERPSSSSSPLGNLAALLRALGINPDQVVQLVQILQDPAFKKWLGNREVTPQTVQQYMDTDPEKFKDLRAAFGDLLSKLSAKAL